MRKGLARCRAKPLFLYGAPREIRTPGLLIRSQTLYPAELEARILEQDLSPILALLSNFFLTHADATKMAEREGFEPSVRVYPVHSLSRRAPSTDSATSPCFLPYFVTGVQVRAEVTLAPPRMSTDFMPRYRSRLRFLLCFPDPLAPGCRAENLAEEVGFEPTELSFNGFQDRRLKPLGHLLRKLLSLIFSSPPI